MSRVSMMLCILLAIPACTGDDDLAADQGRCTNLDEASCRSDGGCQQAYVDDGWSPTMPFRCLLVHAPATEITDCGQLSYGECREHLDCSPFFFQQLGPTDAPEGDPTYKSCRPELQPVSR